MLLSNLGFVGHVAEQEPSGRSYFTGIDEIHAHAAAVCKCCYCQWRVSVVTGCPGTCESNLTVLQVFMPLLEEHASHWLLVCADCQLRRFVVYDSYATTRDKARECLISNAVRM